MTTDLLMAAESWLELHDPFHAERLQQFEDNAPRPLSAVGEAEARPIVTGAVLVGPEREKTLAASARLKQNLGTDAGLEIFKGDPMNGVTSILDIARLNAGYNPLDLKDPERVKKYDLYLSKVISAPFFSLTFSNAQRLVHTSENWDALIDGVVDTFEGIAAEDKKQVAKSLGALAKAAASSEHSSQSEDLFIQSVLQAASGAYEVYIYSSHVELTSDTKKGSTSKQSVFELARAKLRFRAGEWPYLAEKVWRKKVKATDDWLEENTTTPGGLHTNLCLSCLDEQAAG